MDFSNLTTETYAGFILAIVFTIFAFAGGLYLVKNEDCHKVLRILLAVAFPFIAIFCWLYTIISVTNLDMGLNFVISICTTLGFYILLFAVYGIFVIFKKNKNTNKPNSTSKNESKIVEKPIEKQATHVKEELDKKTSMPEIANVETEKNEVEDVVKNDISNQIPEEEKAQETTSVETENTDKSPEEVKEEDNSTEAIENINQSTEENEIKDNNQTEEKKLIDVEDIWSVEDFEQLEKTTENAEQASTLAENSNEENEISTDNADEE